MDIHADIYYQYNIKCAFCEPWTPKTVISSISAVLEGPAINNILLGSFPFWSAFRAFNALAKVIILKAPRILKDYEQASPKLFTNIILGIIFGIIFSALAILYKSFKYIS